MTRNVLMAAALAAMLVPPMIPGAVRAEGGLAEFSAIKPDVAVEMAQAALKHCRDGGYQVSVAVVDRSGLLQVMIRDRFAGPHTVDTAKGKAWTAVSFRANTLELDRAIGKGELSEGLRSIPGALVLGGGMPVQAAGSTVGGIGISGAPDPAIDAECAQAGIDAIADKLDF